MYVFMKTMCPPGYHLSGFVATHALERMMYDYTLLIPMYIYFSQKLRLLSITFYITEMFVRNKNVFFWLYIYIYIYIYILYVLH